MNPTHRLADKDRDARTATCSVCGPVKILPAGRGWVCATKKRAQKAEWAAANPERVAASRARPGAHRLTYIALDARGSQTKLADCSICGAVVAVPWGRGWICKTRAEELRKIHQNAPAQRCRDCKNWQTTLTEGRCPACLLLSTPHRSLDSMYRPEPQWATTVDLLIRRNQSDPPDDGRDRTNPGLKVIGDRNVPEEWRWALQPNPDWSKLDSM